MLNSQSTSHRRQSVFTFPVVNETSTTTTSTTSTTSTSTTVAETVKYDTPVNKSPINSDHNSPDLLPPTPPSSSKPASLKTSVIKGQYGIGLDLGKTVDGRAVVQKLKTMAAGVINPASLCNPAILSGDVIIAVNGNKFNSFPEIVKSLRSCPDGKIELTLERS
jgi:hypothetical protein